ncbi:hypothetical protein R50073_36320 [Maricurvus nonylphenolicus]|uniref:acyl-CoA dehydrogenase family protein n=1 Tax=Maricurvus nonylphenolicus TaxID=1008307 RepID=UPI0036F30BD7
MSLADSNTLGENPYNFEEYLAWRESFNIYEDVPFIKQAMLRYAGDLSSDIQRDITQFAKRVSTEFEALSEAAGNHANAPYMVHFDGHNNRIDRIVRPAETLALEKAVWEEAVFAEEVDPWARFMKIYLLTTLGESGINCAHCCTGGLNLLLERFADTPELKRIHQHLTEGIDGEYGIAAQFLSEIQGGSDVAANCVEAVEENGQWRIYGNKFFCSAAHADYAVITAKPQGSDQVALFVVPSWLPGDKAKEKRNSFTINKIKSKLGTRELPTGEIQYNGSIAYPIGPLDRGLANIVGIVLSHSRFISGLGPGAQMLRVTEEAKQYARQRTVFGVTIKDYGLVAAQLNKLDRYSLRTTAASFKLQSEILKKERFDHGEKLFDSETQARQHAFHVRMLIMLHKMVATTDAAMISELAMSIFGGHGLMEDFSSHPRLFRDATTLAGAWEGPKNLLLTRLYMDFQAGRDWYPVAEFVGNLLQGAPQDTVSEMTTRLEALLDHGTLMGTDEKTLQVCEQWEAFCFDFTHAYQDQARVEVESLL